jgi:hypothetical protein
MIVPERVSRLGNVVPAFQIDDEYAEQVLAHKWFSHGMGYLQAHIEGRVILMHRFVWPLKHGQCPAMIDHINGDKRDNRLVNLRPASRQLNNRNRRQRNRGSGLPTGVCRSQRNPIRPFSSQIRVGGRKRHLGCFATPEEASAAYERARAEQLAIEAQESEAQFQKEIAQ